MVKLRIELDPTTEDGQRKAASRALTDQFRRIIHRLVVVRPTIEEIEAATRAASEYADRLDQLKVRESEWGEVSEAGLNPRDFVERSPLSGPSNPLAPPMELHLVGEMSDQKVEAFVTLGQAYEGPPGHVHGGFVAAMFDELLGYAQFAPGYTAQLTINYKKRTPLERQLHLKAWVDREEGRKRYVFGECWLDGELLSSAEGLFISPKAESYASKDDPRLLPST